jgi:hypothetical protein
MLVTNKNNQKQPYEKTLPKKVQQCLYESKSTFDAPVYIWDSPGTVERELHH